MIMNSLKSQLILMQKQSNFFHFQFPFRKEEIVKGKKVFMDDPPRLRLRLALSHPSYYKYTCAPLSKLPSCAPAPAAYIYLEEFWLLMTVEAASWFSPALETKHIHYTYIYFFFGGGVIKSKSPLEGRHPFQITSSYDVHTYRPMM